MHGHKRNFGNEKPKNAKSTLKRIFSYIGKQKMLFAGMIIFSLISSIAQVSISFFIKPLVDECLIPLIGKPFTLEAIKPLIIMMVKMSVVVIFGVVASFFGAKCSIYLTQKVLHMVRGDLFNAIESLPISFFDKHPHGEIMSRFTNDVESLRMFVSQGITSLLTSATAIIGSFVIMMVLNPFLTLFVVLMMVILIFITKKVGKKSSLYFKKQQKKLGEANGYIEEIIEGQKVVKVFNHEAEVKENFEKLNESLRKASTNANTFASILFPLTKNISLLDYAITAVFGGIFAIKGYMSVGAVITFLQYTRNFSEPISNVSQQFNNVVMALAGAERIFEFMDEAPELDEGYVTLVNAKIEGDEITETPKHTGTWAWKHAHSDGTVTYKKLCGKVVFEDVTFSYDGKKDVLKNVSLYAKPGQKIAFVGSTGAGKTTITNLINRFYEIDKGKIRYDDINISKIKKDDLRRSLSIVLQDTHLFTGTVEENIRYGNLDATHEQIVNASKLANAHEFIENLPQGYDTVLTGDGANLSQGQRQLISIARAAVADAPVLILDEATSSIDTRTEKSIQEGMDKLMKGRTVFVIAHRLSTVRNSNAIMVLENGEIIERGDHDDLLEQKGKYYQLYTGAFEENQ